MVWFLVLRPDDAKQDPVVYGTKFSVVFLAEGPRTVPIQKGFDCLGPSRTECSYLRVGILSIYNMLISNRYYYKNHIY